MSTLRVSAQSERNVASESDLCLQQQVVQDDPEEVRLAMASSNDVIGHGD